MRGKQGQAVLKEAYDVTRLAAKEVMVVMLSDLDRLHAPDIPHAIPVSFGLAGYSVKTENIRSLLFNVLRECVKRGLHVPVLSSDGQFYKLAVQNRRGEPLTVLQLAKNVWKSSCKITKSDQVSELMNVNYPGKMANLQDVVNNVDFLRDHSADTGGPIGPLHVNGIKGKKWEVLITPSCISKLVPAATRSLSAPTATANPTIIRDAHEGILEIPTEVLQVLPVETVDEFLDIPENLPSSKEGTQPQLNYEGISDLYMDDDNEIDAMVVENEAMNEITEPVDCDMIVLWESFHHTLKTLDQKRSKLKFETINSTELPELFASASTIDQNFTRDELIKCVTSSELKIQDPMRKGLKQMRKTDIVNHLSMLLGDKSNIEAKRKRNPKSLRLLCKDFLCTKCPKLVTNAITATRKFRSELPAWRENCLYQGATMGDNFSQYIWYSKPEFVDDINDYVLFMLDAHHLFVNARALVCSKGIPAMGVYRDAFTRVVNSQETKLSAAMVYDVINRQSNAIAQIVFSEEVEQVMRRNGDTSTAEFCRTIRRWYEAEDEPGLSAQERFERRLQLRRLLLDSVSLGDFPPPGNHICGMPVVMFEGFMTNIDRRIQLHALVKGGSYNVWCPNTLDSENFFGEFQSLDPKGSGVLSPDDIPQALEAGSYILHERLNPSRTFCMRTSRYPRVYQVHNLENVTEAQPGMSNSMETGDGGHYCRHINLV